MEKRIIMNSSNLQRIFTKEYEEFFATNNLIVSSPSIINRGSIVHLHGIREKVVQKLPTKLHIGINMRKDDIIHFKTDKVFFHNEQKFEERDIETEKNKEMIENMKKIIKEKLLSCGIDQGLDIAMLSENERGKGVTVCSVEAVLLSFAIHIISGKILPEQLVNNYTAFTKSKEFKNVYLMAKSMMESIAPIAKEHINTTLLFTAMINKGNIGVGFGSKTYVESTYPKTLQIEKNACLEHIGLNPEQVVEYSIISFGGFFNEFYNTETYFNIQKEYEAICKNYKAESISESLFIDTINFLYLKIFESAKEAMIYPNDEYLVNKFFANINKLGSYETFLEGYLDLYRDIVSAFKKNMVFDDEKMGLIPISSSKLGGTFMCITRSQQSRETLQKMIEELRVQGYTTANFQYQSREDGISEDGLIVEQYLDKDHFSVHIKDGDVVLEYGYTGAGTQKKIIGNHRVLLEQATNSIVFDTIDGKIYTNKELTSHNEILTQSGTVEILKILIENMGSYVNNSKLPVSSYSKNKNEMVGKIIGPLQELVKSKFNEKLDLKCTGSIVNFDLKLMPNNVNIHLLKRIH